MWNSNKVVENIIGKKPLFKDKFSRNNIRDDWNSMGTVERVLTLSNSRKDFLDYLEDAYKKGYLDIETYAYYKQNTPNTKDYNKIVEWYYNR